MVAKLAQAAMAANRDVYDGTPSAFQDCSSVIHIAIFFDGTGNNQKVDAVDSNWSNVARIFYSANLATQEDSSRTLFPIYIAGVGTPFNAKPADWLAGAGTWIEDTFSGSGAGGGGDRRMKHGEDSVNESLRNVLIANAKAMGSVAAKYAADSSLKSFREVNAALNNHRLIKRINLSVFGFSRGAALARAFTNRILAQCERRDGDLLYQKYPFRLSFLGLFDTVASFGVPAQNVRTPFTERELSVPDAVERCVHYVAAHELRFSFPVDLIRKNGKLGREWVEQVYPGVHSDVGGGYKPNEQEIDSNYARIPMREMMREALLSGVRILSYDHLKKTQAAAFAARFECRRETELAFERYSASCTTAGGTVEQQIIGHLKLYYSAHGTMRRRGIKSAGERSLERSKYKYCTGSRGMAFEVWAYRLVQKAGRWLRFSDSSVRRFAQYVQIQDWQLSAWDSNAADGAVDFVSRFIHDSKVDFLGNIEPFSYFRPRGVDESSISVWQEGGNWLRGKAAIMGSQVSEAVAISRKEAREAARAAKEAADTAQRYAAEAAEVARRKANEAEALANTAYDAAARAARDAADVAEKTASDASAFASRKSKEAAAAAYNTAAAFGKEAVAAGKQKIEMVESSGERIYENGSRWIRRIIKASDELGR